MSTGGISPCFLTVQSRKPVVEELRQRIISMRDEEIEGKDLIGKAVKQRLHSYENTMNSCPRRSSEKPLRRTAPMVGR